MEGGRHHRVLLLPMLKDFNIASLYQPLNFSSGVHSLGVLPLGCPVPQRAGELQS